MVIVLPDHGPGTAARCRFFTSNAKKPWLRELTALLPVPATLLSWRPVSRTRSASSRFAHTTLRKPATTLRSGENSVFLKRRARRFCGILPSVAAAVSKS